MIENSKITNDLNAISYYDDGINLLNTGAFEDAIKYFYKSIEIDSIFSEIPDIWYHLGTAFYNLSLHEKAIGSYNHAIELCEENFDNIGNNDGDIEAHMIYHPKYPISFLMKGLAAFQSGSFEAAASCAQIAFELNPEYAFALHTKIVEPLICDLDNEDCDIRVQAVMASKFINKYSYKNLEEAFYLTYNIDLKNLIYVEIPVEKIFPDAEVLIRLSDKIDVDKYMDTYTNNICYLLEKIISQALDLPSILEFLYGLINKNPAVRSRAAYELGKLKDPEAAEELISALKDKESGVRYRSAEALGKIGDTRALEPLVNALKDTNFYVRNAAENALAKINDSQAKEALHKYNEYKSNLKYLLSEGFKYLELMDYDCALEAYGRILDNDPQNTSALISRGIALYCLGKHDDAFLLWNIASEGNPNTAIARVSTPG